MAKIEYTKAEKALIKKLKGADIELTGEESGAELQTLSDQYDLENTDEITEQEEIDGVPNKLPIKTEKLEIGGKPHDLPIFFVAIVKGGKHALYDYQGKRVSPAYGADDVVDPGSVGSIKGQGHIAKAAAKFNAMRRKNIIPGEAHYG